MSDKNSVLLRRLDMYLHIQPFILIPVMLVVRSLLTLTKVP
jgi:hypothetical protein